MSLHKAQGSHFPRVIDALSETGMIDREWLDGANSLTKPIWRTPPQVVKNHS